MQTSTRSAATLTTPSPDVLALQSSHKRRQQVTFTSGVLEPTNVALRDAIAGRNALVVCTPAIDRLYGRKLADYLALLPGHSQVDVMVLRRSESTKTIEAAVEVCERAASVGLRRMSPIIAIGGGVCTDICGLAAALYRRGIPHIKIPTTLLGLVDAGIGTKNAVNHAHRKSLLGTFHPPEYSIIDPCFLATLAPRHLANGMAEILKFAIVGDDHLFQVLYECGRDLLRTRFREPAAASAETIRRSVTGMLAELAGNLFETVDYRRTVDFGHTFSPYFEVASDHRILHGEAVAMDVALSSQIAHDIGILSRDDLDRILSLIAVLELPLAWHNTCVNSLWATLPSITEHRNGDLHLVIPTQIGSRAFIGMDVLSPLLLSESVQRLRHRASEADVGKAQRLEGVGR